VPAAELEALVVKAVRERLPGSGTVSQGDQELIEAHVQRVTWTAMEVRLWLRPWVGSRDGPVADHEEPGSGSASAAGESDMTIAIPWTIAPLAASRGVVHVPACNTPLKLGSREILLITIAKARRWIKQVSRGQSFADIARQEGKTEQSIRHLTALAFVSPRVISAVIDGIAPAGLSPTSLVRALPESWAEQERRFEVRLYRPGLDETRNPS
jgi:hypothetical protein